MFSKTKYSLLVVAIALLFSISGVFAVWVYSEGVISPVDAIVGVDLFEWLPGMGGGSEGDGTDDNLDSAGTNHNEIVEAIVPSITNPNTNSATNINNANSTLSQNITNFINNKKGSMSGQDSISGGNMKHLFPTADSSSRLVGLILQFGVVVNGNLQLFEDGNLYYLYTFDTVETANGDEWSDKAHIGELAVVWRTTINKVDGVWTRGVSEQGYAPKIAGNKNKDGLSIDHHLWVKGEIPTT